jgi:hypothetical protein
MAESSIRRLRSSYGSATAATELLYLETLLMHSSRKKKGSLYSIHIKHNNNNVVWLAGAGG